MQENFEIWDAHIHFLSFNFFKTLMRMRGIEAISAEFAKIQEIHGIEIPPVSPVQLARRWLDEMKKYNISKLVLFSSIPNDEVSVSTAITAFPENFIGFFMINPFSDSLDLTIKNAFENLNMKGILIYPAMFHLHVYDEILEKVYSLVQNYGALVFIHFGLLRIPIREMLGFKDEFDLRFSNPLDLNKVARRFPDVNFIVPHFGAGFFRELLFVGSQCANVYVDTSSSNSWIKLLPYNIGLKDVFAKAIDVFGVERIIFGTDSGVFPRGYRIDILNQQIEILTDLGLTKDEIQKILSGNLKKILRYEDKVSEGN